MKINKSYCRLCGGETDVGFIFYNSVLPICIDCATFIKNNYQDVIKGSEMNK